MWPCECSSNQGITVYNESFEAEKFRDFRNFFTYMKLFKMAQFIYEFKRKYEGFCESFSQGSACATCHKTFLSQNLHGIRYILNQVVILQIQYINKSAN